MLTRFAPSPTGPLHLGHAYSALTVWRVAAEHGGAALLRVENFDSERCKPPHEAAIYEDLAWLGLSWPTPVRRVSDHLADYERVIDRLAARGLLYPCSCSRGDIKRARAQPGWDGLVYPGTCRARSMESRQPGDALRLDLERAFAQIGRALSFTEIGPLHPGAHVIDPDEISAQIGDPVLIRKGTNDPAYHLVAPHDDAAQGISHVVRGADLWRATFLHVVIQALMGWPTPIYHHHDLIRDEDGKRLAKIDASKALAAYRAEGASPADIRAMVGF